MPNPFVTLEALYEHVGSLRHALELGDADDAPTLADPIRYHLHAVDDAAMRLFQQLNALLPSDTVR